jgi:AraC-like DNA-binding protein/mannose-6-phosphate isomerase-like protein (cupin superfamily)
VLLFVAVFVESIKTTPEQSLRLLSWNHEVERVRLHVEPGKHRNIVGSGAQWHRHPEIELTVVKEGEGLHLVGDRLTRFSSGEVVLIGRNVPHYWRMESSSTGYCVQFDPQLPLSLWRSPELEPLQTLWRRCESGLRLTGQLVGSVQAAVEGLTSLSPMSGLGRLIGVLESISVAAKDDLHALASESFRLTKPGEPYDDSIASVVNIVTTRYHEPLRLDEIVSRLPLSRATFTRHFKASTGKTFSEFLTEVRINHVCHALVTSKRHVTEIAYESGFNDLPHFNRTFRKMTGHTPLAFRRLHQTQP